MRTELLLRFDYGAVIPWARYREGEMAVVAGPDAAWLQSPVELIHDSRLRGTPRTATSPS
ncbi:hypothetical protein GCM10027161_56180 [Microbispora hainanensis]